MKKVTCQLAGSMSRPTSRFLAVLVSARKLSSKPSLFCTQLALPRAVPYESQFVWQHAVFVLDAAHFVSSLADHVGSAVLHLYLSMCIYIYIYSYTYIYIYIVMQKYAHVYVKVYVSVYV